MAKSFSSSPGLPFPMGATVTPDGINFAVFSRHAKKVTLVLFPETASKRKGCQAVKFPLDRHLNKTGDIWHILIENVTPHLMYGFQADGDNDPKGTGHFYNGKKLLIDPYARALADGETWGDRRRPCNGKWGNHRRRSLVIDEHFDWEGDRPLNIPLKDSIIYEMHVRGFTCHKSSGVDNPGTYAGIAEKIPYLQELGITAVELMPVTEFNELENVNIDPDTGLPLKNFWGYSPLAFFAPKASYAVNGHNGNQVREFKEMVKALHKAGIEVILDVVFNHTAEGGADGPNISFRGLDNTIYYLLDHQTKEYLNFSGCGNTLNCNHPLVRNFIMDCLRYWVIEMHVDGFRFDLASILGRDQRGEVLSNPPMVEQIAEDPILANIKIIAEAWDAAGLYQVGSFSASPRWAEWNGRFRDDVRAFMCGSENTVPALATRIAGSSDLYQNYSRTPFNSINFITSHDGFTLYDLVSYDKKYNLKNGENNADGSNHNISWNSGKEGKTASKKIAAQRARRIRTFGVILFLSQGVPMLLAGDEFGRTQLGNNNAYCQDNAISWLDWKLVKKNNDLLRFFKGLIALRKKHSIFRRSDFFPDSNHSSLPEITWQPKGEKSNEWSSSTALAFFLDGRSVADDLDNDFFVMLNGHRKKKCVFIVPSFENGGKIWRRIIDTANPSPEDIVDESAGELVAEGHLLDVAPMGAVVLISSASSQKK